MKRPCEEAAPPFYDTRRLFHEPTLTYLRKKADAVGFARRCLQPRWAWNEELRIANSKVGNTLSLPGVEVLANLRAVLNEGLGVKRSQLQTELHEDMICMCLPSIFHNEWKRNYLSILRMFGLQKRFHELLVITPRRFGKTWSTGMFCAAYSWCVPNANTAVYSTGKRMAAKLIFLCYAFMLKLPGFKDKVTRKTAETIELDFGPNDKRTLSCYPGTVSVCSSPPYPRVRQPSRYHVPFIWFSTFSHSSGSSSFQLEATRRVPGQPTSTPSGADVS